MADPPTDTWTRRFLDYIGLGLILTGTDILVREAAIILTIVLWVVGALFVFGGLKWHSVKQRLSSSMASSINIIANDFRYWLGVLAFLILAARIAPIFYHTEVPRPSVAAPSSSVPLSSTPAPIALNPEQKREADITMAVKALSVDDRNRLSTALFQLSSVFDSSNEIHVLLWDIRTAKGIDVNDLMPKLEDLKAAVSSFGNARSARSTSSQPSG
jgi:hypothetical protein